MPTPAVARAWSVSPPAPTLPTTSRDARSISPPNAAAVPQDPPPPKLSVGPFDFTSVGVRIRGKPTLEGWRGPLHFALWCQKAGPWWIGDLLNAGDDQFGELFYQMCGGAISPDMLNRYASVARRVPIGNRLPTQSWSAHAAVARLEGPQQRRWLREAERRGWSSEELRTKVRDFVRAR